MAWTGHPYVKSVTTMTIRSTGLRNPSGSSTGTKRLFTDFTAIPLPFPIVDHDGALILLASCRTRQIRAKWFRRVHWFWVCLHKPQYAYGRLLFQVLLLFSPDSGVLPQEKLSANLDFVHFW